MAALAALKDLIGGASPETATAYFRSVSDHFRPSRTDASDLLKGDQDLLENLEELGQIEFPDGQVLQVLCGKLIGEQSSRRSRTAQHEVTRQIALKQNWADAGLFVFHDNEGRFRFGLVATTYQGRKREFSSWRRYSYFIDPAEGCRTFLERVGGCNWSSLDAVREAFSVEQVTREFYKDYAVVFGKVKKAVGAANDIAGDDLHLYTQLLFNRLMFLRFIEKKGWL